MTNLIMAFELIKSPRSSPMHQCKLNHYSPLPRLNVATSRTMSESSALLFATLLSLAALLHSLPVPAVRPQQNHDNMRYRRKVAQLEIGSTPMDYMIQLKTNLSDERGTPKNYTVDPTSVWCFMDKGNELTTTCARTIVLTAVNFYLCLHNFVNSGAKLNKPLIVQSIVERNCFFVTSMASVADCFHYAFFY